MTLIKKTFDEKRGNPLKTLRANQKDLQKKVERSNLTTELHEGDRTIKSFDGDLTMEPHENDI
jgi:hypothetical protein